MSLQLATSFWGRGLAVWLALCMIDGKDPGPPPGEENRDVTGELGKTDEWVVDSDLSTECGSRKRTKRSSPSDITWLRDANCQIVSVTTALPENTPTRVSTKDPGKATTRRVKAASPQEGPRLLYFMPYPPHRQHTAYNILLPVNRGFSGHNAVWYYRSLGEDSSEEKRRKRDTLPTSQKRNPISLEGNFQ